MTSDRIMATVRDLGLPLVEITGGEPLLQAPVLPLMRTLCDEGYRVLLETSGALSIAPVDERVVRIVDFKTPSSGEEQSNHWENVNHLQPTDEVKFVVGDRNDYEWARTMIDQWRLDERCRLLMGTVFGRLDQAQLAEWIVEDRLPVRMQLQLHKFIWGPKERGV